jgi:branched-chain amino acid transport system permease protein
VAALIGLVVAVPLMRLAGLAAGIATLSLLIIVHVVLSHWESVTGGPRTLLGIPLSTTMAIALVWAVVAILVAFVFQRTSLALRLRASREDEIAARSLGISVTVERGVAFVLSAFLVGVSGSLFAHLQGSIHPNAFYFQVAFITIVMLVVGGMGSLAGAVVGTVVVSAMREGLRQVEKGVDLGVVTIPSRPGLTEVDGAPRMTPAAARPRCPPAVVRLGRRAAYLFRHDVPKEVH